jgi:hypothetical protein
VSKGNEDKNMIVNKPLILECLQELSDLDFQRRVWVRGIGNEISGLEDVVGSLYGSSALDFALEQNEETFNPEIDSKLKRLGEMFHKLDRERPTSEIIETEEWEKIREFAGCLYQAIED